jgi:hypothetical protein
MGHVQGISDAVDGQVQFRHLDGSQIVRISRIAVNGDLVQRLVNF